MRQLDLSGIQSSYAKNQFGHLFYSLARIHRPRLVVELGTLMGYSGLHIASALGANSEINSDLHLIDLWHKYPHKHCSIDVTRANFERNGLTRLPNCAVHFVNADAYQSHGLFQAGSVDMMHIDISNDGTSLKNCLDHWHAKLKTGAILILEGGSEARDNIAWMQEYKKVPIRSFLKSEWFGSHYEFTTLEPFPSVTIARRLR